MMRFHRFLIVAGLSLLLVVLLAAQTMERVAQPPTPLPISRSVDAQYGVVCYAALEPANAPNAPARVTALSCVKLP